MKTRTLGMIFSSEYRTAAKKVMLRELNAIEPHLTATNERVVEKYNTLPQLIKRFLFNGSERAEYLIYGYVLGGAALYLAQYVVG